MFLNVDFDGFHFQKGLDCGTLQVAVHPDASYFIILLCLTQDDFTGQGRRAAI
jgi:hypothetical protein